MADPIDLVDSQTHNNKMEVDTISLADAPPKRYKVVQLSGPIKILLPIEEGGGIDDHNNTEAVSEAPASCAPTHAEHNNNVDEEYRYWAEASDCGESDRDVREVSPLKIGMIGLVAPAVEGDTEVKKFDCNNPDDTMSPL
jgi:hypothetical protein